jgi:hypothetical protein
MSNDRQRPTEQPAAGAPAVPPPPEWARQQERLLAVVQALVVAVTELSAAIGRMTARADDMYVEDEREPS